MSIANYSTTADNNTSISGINIAEGCPPSSINNAIRQVMADLAGANFGPNSMTIQAGRFYFQDTTDNTKFAHFDISAVPTGNTVLYAFPVNNTTLVGTDSLQTIINKTIQTSAIDNSNIGLNTPAGGKFTQTAVTDGTTNVRTLATSGQGFFGTSTNHPLVIQTNGLTTGTFSASGGYFMGSAVAGQNGFQINDPSGNYAVICSKAGTGAAAQVLFLNSNGAVGSITTSGSSTSFNVSSDRRLKENIVPIGDVINTLTALEPCRYTFKVDGGHGVGFIAQDLMNLIPEAVTPASDDLPTFDPMDPARRPAAVDLSKLVPYLVAGLQYALAEIKTLKGE